MLQLASFFTKLVVGTSSYTACCWSISQPYINHLLSSKSETLMGNPLHSPDAICSRRSLVPTKSTPESATTPVYSFRVQHTGRDNATFGSMTTRRPTLGDPKTPLPLAEASCQCAHGVWPDRSTHAAA